MEMIPRNRIPENRLPVNGDPAEIAQMPKMKKAKVKVKAKAPGILPAAEVPAPRNLHPSPGKAQPGTLNPKVKAREGSDEI